MIEYAAKQNGVFQPNNIDEMDKLPITETEIYCRETHRNNGNEEWSGIISYNLFEKCHKYRTLILETCTTISSTPSFLYCDEELIDIISEIQLNHLLRMLPKQDDPLHRAGIVANGIVGLGKGYQKLKAAQEKLKKYSENQVDFILEEISPEEVHQYQEEQIEILKQNPEIIKILAALQQQEQKR